MAAQILVTKLHIPRPRPRAVTRPRLVARLNDGLHNKITLISAPPGFGKTSLLSEWVAGCDRPVAWLSLDEADSDPARFLEYLIAALRTVAPQVGEGALRAFQSSQPPQVESILIALLNDIAARPDPILLVLDDYHLVDAEPVDQAVAFLLDHMASQIHLAIATREDPRLPLARMRARGQMTEVRAADLRFGSTETASFLNEAMGLQLPASDITALELRTEGWIAGLQLAALSIQGRDDVSGFIRDFAGGDRHIVDYLAEEVLQRQPEPVRAFLLQTSVLDRLNGSLCDAVTGRDDSRRLLESLERGNLFLVPLDDTRLWYRYHHLFAEVLRAYAMEHPDQVAAQHRRASEWYACHDLPDEAIGHALAAGDVARASDLIELAATAMRRNRQEATLLGWLRSLPIEVFRSRPVLSAVFGGVLLSCGQPDGVEERLRDAERWLDTADDFHVRPEASPSGMIVVDEDEFRRLPGAIVVYRSGQSLAQGDVASTMHYARRALELVPEDDHLYRGAAASLLGLASWASGDLETAYGSYAEGMTRLRKAGYIADTIGGALALADIRIAQGRLRDAMSTCQDALRQAAAQGTPALRGTADMYVAMSELSRERNDLNAAMQYLVRSAEQGEHTGFPQHPWRSRVAMARIREARGDLDGAIDLLIEAERLYVSDMFPNMRPLAAQKARLWIAQGNLADAMGWVRECNLSVEDPLTYLREYEHITLARVLVVRFRSDREHTSAIDEAMGLLERLQEAAKTGTRTGSEIEILMLLALAHEARGDIPWSLPPLERALALAEPEDYVRLFVAEGPQMARLLSEALKRGVLPGYTSRLLAAIGGGTPGDDHPRASHVPGLVEPLSQRELEVLRLIAQGLSNHEIGERLYLALSTVKGHNRVIFAKLDVQRRTEAVARARDLGLL